MWAMAGWRALCVFLRGGDAQQVLGCHVPRRDPALRLVETEPARVPGCPEQCPLLCGVTLSGADHDLVSGSPCDWGGGHSCRRSGGPRDRRWSCGQFLFREMYFPAGAFAHLSALERGTVDT